jgi:extracellular elastinolytic metalloproteinase
MTAGNPSTGSTDITAVTANAFKAACAVPPAPAQGADSWVTKLPDRFGDGALKFEVRGGGTAPYDLDLYFYDTSCALLGTASSSAPTSPARRPPAPGTC